MSHQETRNLVDLAHRLGSSPRRILIAAARLTEQAEPDVPGCLRRIRRNGIHRNDRVEDCARLMLTPIDSYARDSLDTALFALWQVSGQSD